MNTIEQVKQFISDFTTDEYNVNRSKFDPSKTEEEHCNLVETFLEKYFSLFYISLKTGPLLTRGLEYEEEETIEWNFNGFRQRKVFLIRHFKNTEFSMQVQADTKELFACYLGPDDSLMEAEFPPVYTANFSVALVKGELKIISIRFDTDIKDMEQVPFEWSYNQESVEFIEKMIVQNEGTCIETLRLLEPGHESWIKDYYFDYSKS